MVGRNKERMALDTLPDMLHHRAISSPHDVAYSFPERNQDYTWLMVWQEVRLLAQGFIELGIKKGDKVAVLMPGRMELILTMFAAASIGAVIVPLNTYSKKDELRSLLMDAKPAVLIMDTEGNHQHYPSIMQELISECSASGIDSTWLPRHLFVLEEAANVTRPFRPYRELFKLAAEAENDAFSSVCRTLNAQDPLILLYTSGTLGTPKGVLRSTASFMVSRQNGSPGKRKGSPFLQGMTDRLTSRFSVMLLLPLYHLGGFATLITNLKVCNIRIVMLSHFNPFNALTVVSQGKYRFLVGTPFMIQQMLSFPGRDRFDLSSLLGVIFTSSAVNNAVLQRVTRELNLAFFMVSYGSSEAGAVSNGVCFLERKSSPLLVLMFHMLRVMNLLNGSIAPLEFEQTAYSLAGKVDKAVEVRIVHPETEEPLPLHEHGEIVIRSHRVMRYSKEDPAYSSFTRDGWFKSGDLGFLNEKSHLTVTGRLKRLISRGGEKISPIEIENALLKHKDVEDALVIGIPDELYGEQICACIVSRRGMHPTSEHLNQTLAPHLSAFKLPRHYIYLSQFPLSPTGKVSIAALQMLAAAEMGELRENA